MMGCVKVNVRQTDSTGLPGCESETLYLMQITEVTQYNSINIGGGHYISCSCLNESVCLCAYMVEIAGSTTAFVYTHVCYLETCLNMNQASSFLHDHKIASACE